MTTEEKDDARVDGQPLSGDGDLPRPATGPSDAPFDVESALREEYWLNHGCDDFHALYGDDGEMQCHACRHDFKRQPIGALSDFVASNRRERVMKRLWNEQQAIAKQSERV